MAFWVCTHKGMKLTSTDLNIPQQTSTDCNRLQQTIFDTDKMSQIKQCIWSEDNTPIENHLRTVEQTFFYWRWLLDGCLMVARLLLDGCQKYLPTESSYRLKVSADRNKLPTKIGLQIFKRPEPVVQGILDPKLLPRLIRPKLRKRPCREFFFGPAPIVCAYRLESAYMLLAPTVLKEPTSCLR
jgi:hypothetical protein